MMRVSAGTAVALKLLNWKMQEYPTTAYFLQTVDYEDGKYEESCLMGCKFCPLSSSSMGTRDRLSRIIWPAFPRKTLERALLHVHEVGIRRICLQGTRRKESMNALTTALSWISSRVSTPVSVSAWLENIHEVDRLIQAGAERVSIALDVASPREYSRVKGGFLQKRLEFLLEAAQNYPGCITTHLICGLGETEEELLQVAHDLLREDVTVALFAFTPVKGTPLANYSPPEPSAYRRVQAALHLLRRHSVNLSSFRFYQGKLISLGRDRQNLREALEKGAAFETVGCAYCNRPYYNERPGGFFYNYPRPLTSQEEEENYNLLWDSLGGQAACSASHK